MSNAELPSPRVLLFHPNERTLNMAYKGSQLAGWQSLPYDDPRLAFEELDENINALVAGMPNLRSMGERAAVEPLFYKSTELDIPRAIVSSSRDANTFVRDGSLDIVIPTSSVRSGVTKWLLDLAANQ
ncbi:MAG TPA: hypothetical protein VLF39_03340 [Candidatus Saccharimonadales bacterium]|nr:hypothetical protein [Candidatus Saccharimonadales bacterium]